VSGAPAPQRRQALKATLALAAPWAWHAAASGAGNTAGTQPENPERRWFEAAAAMQRLALTWGDQPYGAVLVADGAIIGEGPSRVVLRGDLRRAVGYALGVAQR